MARRLAVILALIAFVQGGMSRAADSDPRRRLLETLLAQQDWGSGQSNSLLSVHGPILPEEIDYLAAKARSGERSVAWNAARLLGIARGADGALRQLAAQSDDAGVVVLALAPILHAPDGAALAAERRHAIQRALSEGGPIAAVALHAAFHAGIPGIADEIRKQLADPSRKMRDAATSILAEAGPGDLEAEVFAIVTDLERRRTYALGDLYRSLMRSDNPATAKVLLHSLQGANSDEENNFSNAVFLSRSRKPWLRRMLLDMASHENRMQWSAFDRLERWGDEAPAKELVAICDAALQARLAGDRPVPRAAEDIETCRKYLGTLAGRTFAFEELREAQDFAAKWEAGR